MQFEFEFYGNDGEEEKRIKKHTQTHAQTLTGWRSQSATVSVKVKPYSMTLIAKVRNIA